MVGGNGEIAWNHLKRSKPDGYTVGLITNAVLENQVMGPETEIKYDSFEYLLQFTHQPIGLFVHKDSGWKKLEDFVAAVKPKPGESAVATAPLGSIFHQAAYLLEKKYGIKLNIVPGRSSADNLAQLLGKHVDSVTMTTTIFIPHLKEGTVRMLLIYTDKRLPDFPDVPSVVELGISDVGLESWRAIAVPKEIPEPVKNTLKTAFKKAYQNPEYQALAKKSFFDPFYREHTEILDYAKKQLPILEKYVNEMGLRKGK
jgi:tripartite-type tricarboxylate transporter receptor subunit TctC